MQTLDFCGQVAQPARIHGRRQFFRRALLLLVCAVAGGTITDLPSAQAADDAVPRDEVVAAMKKAAGAFHDKVAVHGGYVYFVSLDGQQRLGEGKASPEQIWVQPPATPTVGLAFLRAYRATNEKLFLDAARDAGAALIYGQLKSGGWRNAIDFDPQGTLAANYRNGKGKAKGANTSTLDDGATQAALVCLMTLDQALDFKDQTVHEAARFALDSLLAAQYSNGAFPQVWTGPVAPHPIVPAKYPDYDWRTENRVKEYWNLYTLNDQLAGDVTETLAAAHEIYRDDKCLAAIRRLGDFLILAQMPEPQPAWAQQYHYDMQPAWARKFEPPAVTGNESQDVLETLIEIYRLTGDKKYLAPIPAALKYLNGSLLPDGQLARFYELKTNRPLYMTSKYELTYDDSDVPTHYGWKIKSRLASIEKQFLLAQSEKRPAGKPLPKPAPKKVKPEEVRKLIQALDPQGRWVSKANGEPLVGQPKFKPGEAYLSSQTFSRNLETLANFLLQPAP
ncbi:pectate lyase [Planctomyces sp. SH-PL14]|uniref:pectate lyase n=1 Tax=Planctomyces sp. SH-PL14 TaxID=1632864 RepID=UPI00078B4E5C|nr:pectate lyase [Planctomyces sp. SH-PL14]AMV22276.1 Pectic acid lyase [Planctomyces sp. SH-PL14]